MMVGWMVGSRLLQCEHQIITSQMINIYKDIQEEFCVVKPKDFAGVHRFVDKIKSFVFQINAY